MRGTADGETRARERTEVGEGPVACVRGWGGAVGEKTPIFLNGRHFFSDLGHHDGFSDGRNFQPVTRASLRNHTNYRDF
jgi:hypothetical protein